METEGKRRTPKGALRLAMDMSGRSDAELSRALGKNPRYLPNLLNSPSSPSVDLFASALSECGLELVARGRGVEVIVDPDAEG